MIYSFVIKTVREIANPIKQHPYFDYFLERKITNISLRVRSYVIYAYFHYFIFITIFRL